MTKFCRRRVQVCVALSAGMSAGLFEAKLTFAQQNPNDQTVFFNANDASGTSSFNSGGNWQASTSTYSVFPLTSSTVLPAGTAPTAGYAYVVTGSAPTNANASTGGTGLLRTPTTGNVSFAGDSLTLIPYNAPSTNTLDVYPIPVNFAGNTAALALAGTSAQTVTINNLVLANGGGILDLATGTATVLGTIDLVPAGTMLDGITSTVSGGVIDMQGNANGIVLNAALTGTGTLRIFSSTGSNTTALSLNSSNAGFIGTIQPDASVGSNEAASSPNPVLNINNPNALGSGTLLFAAYSPNNGFTTIGNGPSIDNTTGSLETLNGTFSQQWNTNFEFKGTNNLNMGTGAVTVGNNVQLTVVNGTLIEPGQIGGSGTIQLSGAGLFELINTNQINGGVSFNIPAGTTLGFSAVSTTPAQYAANGTFSGFNFNGGYLGVDLAGYTGTYNLSSILSGPMGLREVNASTSATLLLSGVNTYTGPTNVASGILQVGNAAALASTGNLQLPSGSTLDLNGFSPSIPLITGPGIVRNSTTTPATLTITAGGNSVVATGSAGANGTSPAFTGNIANGSATTSLTINLPASGAFNISGSTNTYTGTTTLSGGTLLLGAASLPVGNTVVFNGGTLGFIAQPTNDPSLNASVTAGNNYSFNIPSKSLTVALNGPLNGSAGLTLTGLYNFDPAHLNYSGGTLALNSTSSNYSGATTVTGATLSITSPLNLGNTTSVTLNSPPANTSSIATTAGTLLAGGTSNYSFGVPIGGNGIFAKTGTNMVTLTSANTYTGTTNISTGTLQLGNISAISSSSNVSIGSTATLDLNGYSTSLASFNGSGTVTNTKALTPVTLTITAGSTATFSGNISNGAATTSLNIATGGASFNISGATDTYTGSTTLTSGTLLIGAASLTAHDPVVFNGGTLGFTTQPTNDPSTAFSVTSGNGYSFNVPNASTTVTLAANLGDGSGGSTSLTLNGLGTLILTGTTTYTGTTTINGGALAFNGPLPANLQSGIYVAGAGGSFAVGNSSYNYSFGVPVSGAGGLTKIGSDIVTLTSTNNTYTGPTNISNGTLLLGNANALGSSSYTILGANSAAPNGTLDLNGYSITMTQPVGGAYGGVITNSNTATASTLTLVPTNASFLSNSGYYGSFKGNLSLVINFPAPTSNASPVQPFGIGSVAVSNTYTGTTTLQSGVLEISVALPTTPQSIYFTGGALQIAASGIDPSGSFAQTPNQQFNLIPASNYYTVYAGSLNSVGGSLTAGNLSYGGVDPITLTGANNFSGPTNVLSGVLQIANSLGLAQTSSVTVNGTTSLAIGSGPPSAALSINTSSAYFGLTGGVAGGAPITLYLSGPGPSKTLGYTAAGPRSVPTGTGYFGALQGSPNETTSSPAIWAGNIVLDPTAGTGGYNGPTGISGGFNEVNAVGFTAVAATGGALEVSGIISGTGPLIVGMNPLSTTILAGANTYTGETQINCSTGASSTLQLGANNAIPSTSGINFQENPGAEINNTSFVYGSAIFDLNGYNTSVAYLTSSTGVSLINISEPAINGVVTNTKAGTTSVLTILGNNPAPYLGVIQDGAGKVAVNFAGTGLETLSGINNYSGGTIVTSGTAVVPGRSTLGTGNITINGGGLILQNTPSAAVFNLLHTGDNLGNWNGPGINSNVAAGDTAHLTAVGMLTTAYGTTFQGQNLNPGDVALAATYYGDANLDGKVDGSDYSLIDAGYASDGTLTGWQNGDFNYDGVIDGSDYALIDNAFNNQGTPFVGSAALVASETAQVAGPVAAVPEPAGLAMLAVAGLGLLRRRRSGR